MYIQETNEILTNIRLGIHPQCSSRMRNISTYLWANKYIRTLICKVTVTCKSSCYVVENCSMGDQTPANVTTSIKMGEEQNRGNAQNELSISITKLAF